MPARPAAATLLYAPGLGHHPYNTAENVAAVVARSLDRRRQGTYTTDTDTPAAPRGLRAARTVLGPKGQRLLDVYELDYKHRLEDLDPHGAHATIPPGTVAALWDSVTAFVMMRHAARRKTKRANAKLQLGLGLVSTVLLFAATVAAVVVAVSGLGFGWHTSLKAKGLAAGEIAAGTALWAKCRQPLLTFRLQMHRVLRYLRDERHQVTVTQTLDDALDALLDQRPKATVHVLGYSFGSLVLYDALFPKDGTPDRIGRAVRSLATVGFLHDALMLYAPERFERRAPRTEGLVWRNVFIPSDVLGSNLHTSNDTEAKPATVSGVAVDSRRYTDERPKWWDVLGARGFRMHGGYWDDPDSASCFDLLTDLWVPEG